MEHHASCMRFQAWDMGEQVPCTCPATWPRRTVARNPGEWYEERRQEAERLEAELAGARKVRDAINAVEGGRWAAGHMVDAANEAVHRIERALEQARYV